MPATNVKDQPEPPTNASDNVATEPAGERRSPAWARTRSADEQAASEFADLAERAAEWRTVDPRELGRRMAVLIATASASAQRSPYWERASRPEPMSPEAEARWRRLVAEHKARRAGG